MANVQPCTPNNASPALTVTISETVYELLLTRLLPSPFRSCRLLAQNCFSVMSAQRHQRHV
jgi:hypothetical protein